MTLTHANVLPQILARDRADLLKAWMAEHSTASGRKDLAGDELLGEQAGEFLDALEQAIRQATTDDLQSAPWMRVREILADISRWGFEPFGSRYICFLAEEPCVSGAPEADRKRLGGLR